MYGLCVAKPAYGMRNHLILVTPKSLCTTEIENKIYLIAV